MGREYMCGRRSKYRDSAGRTGRQALIRSLQNMQGRQGAPAVGALVGGGTCWRTEWMGDGGPALHRVIGRATSAPRKAQRTLTRSMHVSERRQQGERGSQCAMP
jgi:hypothetical protein